MPFMRKYGTLLVTGTTAVRIPLIKRGVVDFALGADWTPAAGDVKVFVDGAAVANITNLPTAIASGNTSQWEFVLTAAELSCKQLLVMVSDAATKAVEDQCFIVETYGNAAAMYVADLSLANLPANVTQLLGTAWLAPGVAGTPDVNAKQFGAAPVTATTSVTFSAASTVASTTNMGTAQTGDNFARLGVPAGASVSADLAAVKAETASVQGDTNDLQARLPAALTGAGNMKADVLAINGNATSAAVLALLNSSTVVYQGTVTGAATTTTLIDSGLTQADTDFWKGRIIIFTSVITMQATDITGFTPATDTLTFTAVTQAPTGANYVII